MSDTPPVSWRIERHARLSSTNDRAIEAADAGEPPGLVVLAGEQTAGRGRSGRKWHSPPGNLYCSVLLPPGEGLVGGAAALLSGLALHDALSVYAPGLRLKWPNDLLAGAAKLGGVLVEGGTTRHGAPWLVAGIGANLASAPELADRQATSLAALGAAPTPEEVADRLVARLAARLEAYGQGAMAGLVSAWAERALPEGTAMSVKARSGMLAGRYAGLDRDGALLLATEQGLRRVVAGEVFAEV
ncbi:biotin--[acetyl-CoA-carboxylase] ligase [Elioraea rosea]|uniref:biotin--[acetyl-CoA-carboxylase] ligase n=1 Tax=Elioraea rosea TaxID=2492390 RepID=UPI0011822268|nr:biotin--[acetyl-CoA-carboxylase] ligase [Elioraea rosea]